MYIVLMRPIHEFIPIIRRAPARFVITTHHRPDADAMGSSLALANSLQALGHSVIVICPNRPADFLMWMPGIDKIFIYEEQADICKALINECDWIFCLDYNVFSRTAKMEDMLEAASKPKVLIDHHPMPLTKFFEYGISDAHKSSTCEMIYDFLCVANLIDRVDIYTMQLLYAGIIGDTGSFAFPNTTAKTFEIAYFFKKKGLDTSRVYQQLFQSNPANKVKFSGYAITNLLTILENKNSSLIQVPYDTYQLFQLKSGDLEGLVNVPLTIEGIHFSSLVVGISHTQCKWSFRSIGKWDVNHFARNYFNGGGHINAAGGFSNAPIEEAVKYFHTVAGKIKTVI